MTAPNEAPAHSEAVGGCQHKTGRKCATNTIPAFRSIGQSLSNKLINRYEQSQHQRKGLYD